MNGVTMDPLLATAYWVIGPGAGELRAEPISATPPPGRSVLGTEVSGVSSGTERLVGLGLVPDDVRSAMACRSMAGDFTFPLKYGYACVAVGIAGRWRDERVFVMHPHQDLIEIDDEDATPLPDAVPSARAVLIPNLETALNAVWDAELAGDESVVVFGAGSVGVLLAHALHRTHHLSATIVEPDAGRRALAARLPGVGDAVPPEEVDAGAFSVAFHTTGHPAGLGAALGAVGFEGRVIELSWYGTKPVTVALGGSFHHLRKRIIASQVSTIAPSHRATHDFAARLAEVIALLDEPALDGLVGPPVPFASLPELMDALYRGAPLPPLPLVAYDSPAGGSGES